MKRSLFLLAIACMALVSCVKDDVQDLNSQQKTIIGFDSPIVNSGVSTKANVYGEITGTYKYTDNPTAEYKYPRAEDFIIYAAQHSGAFVSWSGSEHPAFNGTSISYDQYIDGWAPKQDDPNSDDPDDLTYYFWDNTKMMSFAALSPANLDDNAGKNSYGDDGHTIAGYTVPSDLTKHYDLMYSSLIKDKSASDMTSAAGQYYGIPIEFKHALTSVHFSLLNETTAEIILKGITINNVKNQATFKENYPSGVPEWEFSATPSTTSYSPFVVSGTQKGAVFPNYSPQYVSQVIVNGIGGSEGTSHYLLVIPQLLEGIQLIVDYTINGTPAQKTINIDDYAKVSGMSGGSISDPTKIVTEWEMGNRYTYRLVYTAGSALKDIIAFSPTTTPWNDIEAIVVPL